MSSLRPSAIKKYQPPKRNKGDRFSILQLSWWFDHQHFNQKENLESFLKILETSLPEALPRRYGAFEPPEFKLEETGFDHLVDFLFKEKSIVATPTKPVLDISIGLNEASGFVLHGTKKKYKCSYMTLSIDADVLAHPDWQDYLPHMWKEVSAVIQPFYGDVRVLKNYLSSKTSYLIDGETEQHPVKAWWWRGIPQGDSLAIVVGDPYLGVCPDIKTAGQEGSGLVFLSSDKWNDGNVSLNAPLEAFQPDQGLPTIFPFDA